MDEMMRKLAREFRNFVCTSTNGSLNMKTNWNGATPGVRAVRVSLWGMDPLTGEDSSAALFQGEFSPTTRAIHSPPLPLYGNYTLRFEAIGRSGSSLGSFRAPYPIRIENPGCRPKLRPLIERDGKWTRLTIESNCPRRWSGHLWAEQDGRAVPLFWEGQQEKAPVSFWFWRERGELRLFSDDPELPLGDKK